MNVNEVLLMLMNKEVLTADIHEHIYHHRKKKSFYFSFYLWFSLNKSKVIATTALHYEALEVETKNYILNSDWTSCITWKLRPIKLHLKKKK